MQGERRNVGTGTCRPHAAPPGARTESDYAEELQALLVDATRLQLDYGEAQAECREVDTMWGDGRWWFCPRCGTKLADVHLYNDEEKAPLRAVTETLVRLDKQELVPDLDSYNLLLDIGHAFKPYLTNCREACLYFYNAREFAQKHNLPTSERMVDYNKFAYQFNVREEQYQVLLPLPQLLEDYCDIFYRFEPVSLQEP